MSTAYKKKYLCKEFPQSKCCKKKYNCFSLATRNFLVLLTIVIGYQVADLFHIVPLRFSHLSHNLKDDNFIVLISVISLIMNVYFLYVFLLKIKILQYSITDETLEWSFKIMIIFFGLTSFSHLFSIYFIDKYIFAPITFFLAYLTYIVMIEKEEN